MRAFDRTGFFIHQTTKVRIRKFLDKGIEVYTYSKDGKLGFIPYCNLVTNIIFMKENHFMSTFLDIKNPISFLPKREQYYFLIFRNRNIN